MEAISTSLSNKKYIVNTLFFILFTWILFAATLNFHSYYAIEIRNTTYMFLAGVALFFIHNMILAPIKLEENNNRKYIILVTVCTIIFSFTEVFLFSNIITHNNIFDITPDHLLSLNSLVKFIGILCIPLLIISVLSIIHNLLVYGFRAISPYLEAFVHIIVLAMIFAFIVTFPDLKNNEISIIISLLLAFYVNTFLITPILLRDKKTIVYILGLLTLLSGYFLVQTILLTSLGIPKFNSETGRPFTRGNIFEIIFNAPGIIILIITLFTSFIYSYARIKTKAKEKSLNIKLGEKESELKLLKSQVNPHFLFNTLNTLYATALNENAEKTGSSITKLANLLRYMQKDINKDLIPLENEIKYLQDYITIQKLRCAVEPQVETQFTNIENQLISPGLFIPFVENAFKYGIDSSRQSKLNVSVICDNSNIHFSCINSYNDDYKAFHKEQGFGIGISNAKQRLELVYPKNHTFEIIKKDNEFSVKITIADNVQN